MRDWQILVTGFFFFMRGTGKVGDLFFLLLRLKGRMIALLYLDF